MQPLAPAVPGAPPWRRVPPAAAFHALWAAAGHLGRHDAGFALKTFLAAMLAFWAALSIGLDRPAWAVVTCFIVAQPLAGAVLSKAMFRLVGSLVGAAMAVLLVPALVNAPELLCAAMALWIGLCTGLGLLDRSPRSYVFLLAGYTAAIVGFPAVSAPGQVFALAAVRLQEIAIGIVTSALVHGLLFPRSVSTVLQDRVDVMLEDAARLTRSILLDRAGDGHEADRAALLRDLATLDTLATHLPFDLARITVRRDLLHALRHQFTQILVLTSAVEDRLARLGDRLPRDLARRLEEGAADLDALAGQLERFEPSPSEIVGIEQAWRLSLLDRLAQLIEAHRAARLLGDALLRSRMTPAVAALASAAHRRARHRDHVPALLGAVSAMLATLAGCALWIGWGWTDGASAVVYAGMVCALFANLDEPGQTARHVVIGVALATGVALVWRFGIMPGITALPVLMAALAPPLLMLATLSQQPGCSGYAIGAILAFPALVGLEDHYDRDFIGFANAAIAQIVGAWLAATALGLVRGMGMARRRAGLLSAARAALRRKLAGKGEDGSGWTAVMLDRIDLLSGLPIETGPAVRAVTRMMRLGIAIDGLRGIAVASPRDAALVRLLERRITRGIAGGYRDGKSQVTIRRALPRLARTAPIAVRRAAVLALTAMAANLDGAA